MNLRGCRGQTLVEFLLILPLMAAAVGGTFWMVQTLVLRTECTRVVFEAVHEARASEGRGLDYRRGIILTRSDEGVKGSKRCGIHTETLFLPYLGKRKSGAFQSPSFF